MKLFDFKKFLPFINLKKNMGIPLDYDANFHIDITINTTTIETTIDPYNLSGNGPFTVTDEYGRKRKVVAYIRDYSPYRQIEQPDAQNWNSTYKYHLTCCDVLKRKQRDGTYDKYTGTNRKDGFFKVNLIRENKIISTKDQDLRVCKKCLEALDYCGYKKNYSKRQEIFENFSLEEYLKNNDTDFVIDPKFTENESPPNVYDESFSNLSRRLKEMKNFICEECGLDCSIDPRLLDTHHINGVKSNNSPSNLRVLCIGCHTNIHEHLKHGRRWEFWLENKYKAKVRVRKRFYE